MTMDEAELQSAESQSSVLQLAVGEPTRCLQWAGLFPPHNPQTSNSDNQRAIRYQYKILYRLYSAFLLFGQCVIGMLVCIWFFSRPLNIGTLPNMIFYGNISMMAILLCQVIRYWPEFVQKALTIEKFMSDSIISKKITKKCFGLFIFFFFFGIAEHILNKLYLYHMVSMCSSNNTVIEILLKLERANLPFIVGIFDNQWLLIFFEIIVLRSTFLWILIDIVIMSLCVYISTYFKKLNDLIKKTKTDARAPWKEYREYHALLISFLHLVNKHMGPFIIMSMVLNLFFICIQMFNVLDQNHSHRGNYCKKDLIEEAQRSLQHTFYYIYSATYLILKTLTIILLAGEVHTTAREPIFAMCSVPGELYGQELQRFNHELRYSNCSISGIFFDVTKDKVVKVIGKIVIYELILLQLRQVLEISMEK